MEKTGQTTIFKAKVCLLLYEILSSGNCCVLTSALSDFNLSNNQRDSRSRYTHLCP